MFYRIFEQNSQEYVLKIFFGVIFSEVPYDFIISTNSKDNNSKIYIWKKSVFSVLHDFKTDDLKTIFQWHVLLENTFEQCLSLTRVAVHTDRHNTGAVASLAPRPLTADCSDWGGISVVSYYWHPSPPPKKKKSKNRSVNVFRQQMVIHLRSLSSSDGDGATQAPLVHMFHQCCGLPCQNVSPLL